MPLVDDKSTKAADQTYIRDAMDSPMLSREEEQALAVRWRDKRDVKAMQRIINSYRRLVVAHASKFKRYGLPLSDLIQEGNIGLMEAINRFEPERDIRFSTYAAWWIRSCLQDYVLRNWSIVRTGTTSAQKALFFNLKRLKARIAGREGHDTSESDMRSRIAADMGVSLADVERMDMRLAANDQSLNIQIGESGETELQSLLPSNEPNPEDVVIGMKDAESRSRWLNDALLQLGDREQRIIKQRHLSHSPVTLEDLGKTLGISKERVRQIESRALTQLKSALIEHVTDRSELF